MPRLYTDKEIDALEKEMQSLPLDEGDIEVVQTPTNITIIHEESENVKNSKNDEMHDIEIVKTPTRVTILDEKNV